MVPPLPVAQQYLLATIFAIGLTAAPLAVRAEWDDRFAPFFLETGDLSTLYLEGPIDARSPLAFSRALDELTEVRTIILSSPGGDVYSALLIASEIDRRGLATVIPHESICYSACSFLYLAGHRRETLGSLGVHQISSEDPDLVSGQIALSDILEMLNGFGVPNGLIVLMLRTAPEDMYVLTSEEIDRYSLTGTRIAGSAPAAPPVQEEGQSSASIIDGTYRNGGLSVVIKGELVGVTVSEPGCLGQFDAMMREESDRISFVGEGCTIAVTKLGPFDFSMEQGPGCSSYHGAACGFSGYVRGQ